MHPNRFLATALAAALIACPAIALAQGAAAAGPPAGGAPATPPPAPAVQLPTIPKVAGGADIYATLKDSGQFTILVKALDQANISALLQRTPNLTLFAPTDAAFQSLPPDVLAKLMAANDTAANQLQQILAYHLINLQIDSSKIKGAKGDVPSVERSPVKLDGSDPNDLLVNNADIIQADIRTTNGGVINVIDKVLVPPDSPYASAVAASSPPPATSPAPPAAGATPAPAMAH